MKGALFVIWLAVLVVLAHLAVACDDQAAGPRGDQLEVTVTATIESDAGEEVVRQATDRWPP